MVLAPDAEKVVSDYLRDHDDVAAITSRIRGTHPDKTVEPWVRVTQMGGPQTDVADHLLEAYFQFDCYAGHLGGHPEAVDLARTVRAAIVHINEVSHDDAVVTAGEIVGFERMPDSALVDDKGKARERVIVTAYVYMHA